MFSFRRIVTASAERQARVVAYRSITGNISGNVSFLFAIIIIPVVGAIGLAADFGMEAHVKAQVQHALDGAVIAGVSALYAGDDPTAEVNNHLRNDLANLPAMPTVAVSHDPAAGTVSATAELTMGTSFMGILGIDRVKIDASSTAIAGAGGPMQVAIAFDTTGSMAGAKLSAAQEAANDLVDMLFKKPGSSQPNPDVKVGLVPFTYYVNVGTQYKDASWIINTQDQDIPYNSCTYAQLATPVHVAKTWDNDGAPHDCSYDDYNDYQSPTCVQASWHYTWPGCVGSQDSPADEQVQATAANPVPAIMTWDCSAPVIRLSNDPAVIKSAISGLKANYETYIASGVLWGWRLLTADTDTPFADGGPATTTKKRLILMTDGANTHSANYPGHGGTDVAAANAKTAAVCANAKAAGIQIYAIAFDVTDADAQALLSACSSGPPYYYNATTIADLAEAFKKIGTDLTSARLIN